MKYIRTKDGRIVDISNNELFDDELPQTHFEKGSIGLYDGIPVIKQADTIEELCDTFIVKKGDNIYLMTLLPKLYLNGSNIVYGAIWTDKGLIYVAKMKGVLPNGEIDWELL